MRERGDGWFEDGWAGWAAIKPVTPQRPVDAPTHSR